MSAKKKPQPLKILQPAPMPEIEEQRCDDPDSECERERDRYAQYQRGRRRGERIFHAAGITAADLTAAVLRLTPQKELKGLFDGLPARAVGGELARNEHAAKFMERAESYLRVVNWSRLALLKWVVQPEWEIHGISAPSVAAPGLAKHDFAKGPLRLADALVMIGVRGRTHEQRRESLTAILQHTIAGIGPEFPGGWPAEKLAEYEQGGLKSLEDCLELAGWAARCPEAIPKRRRRKKSDSAKPA